MGLIPLRLMSRAPLNSPCKIRSAWDDGYCRTKKTPLLFGMCCRSRSRSLQLSSTRNWLRPPNGASKATLSKDEDRLIAAPVKGVRKPLVKGFADLGLLARTFDPKGRAGMIPNVRTRACP